MSKPVLAVDFDDTLVSHVDTMVAAYNADHSDKITAHDVHFTQKVGNPEHGWGGDRSVAMAWIADYLSADHAMETPPITGAVEALRQLKEKYRLMIVTGRDKSFAPATQPWIDRFIPGLFEAVHYAGDTRKSVICNEIGAETIIDDSPVYLADCVAAGINGIAFGDYVWNTDDKLPAGVKRAKTWQQVTDLLQ